jgi:SAM-dependent methyltransferase
MTRDYDTTIQQHYKRIAEEFGLSATSTMADEITRASESKAILQFVSEALSRRRLEGISEPAIIMDIGCGNGYTLQQLSEQFPEQHFIGIEKSDELRSLAVNRFAERDNVEVVAGDIRDRGFADKGSVDILVCQRVLINLLDKDDQKSALRNVVDTVTNKGGSLVFIEAFLSSLEKLNEARAEFELSPIPPAHHNLYLADDFFDINELKPLHNERLPPTNFLSTHYFVTRVLHPLHLEDRPLKRNSEFVRFFTQALKENVGDYSPLKLYMFEKTAAVSV